ncbi:hypothetical protein GP480_01600 [Neorickettsia findlayensis]|uniref:CyaY protein n=2 Tax=Neorickettsia findlayensis TaxID=2686014 RepID=A0A6P1G9K3_9RICK|nr:hypothetical protein GP480_01600 [Neorickettsia findlayensis]
MAENRLRKQSMRHWCYTWLRSFPWIFLLAMNNEVSFSKISVLVLDRIVELAGQSPLCDEYDCNEGVVELFLRQGALLIIEKADLGEIWVSGLSIGAERFYLDSGCFVNKSGEEIVSWIEKLLQL